MEDTRKVKPWEELSEEERQKIRESWKVKLPEKFDVFCDDDWVLTDDLYIPGNLYVMGDCTVDDQTDHLTIHVDEDFLGGYVYCTALYAGGNCTVGGAIDSVIINVCGNLDVGADIQSAVINVGGNFSCDDNVNVAQINVFGNIDIAGRVNVFIHVGGHFSIGGRTIYLKNNLLPNELHFLIGNSFSFSFDAF